MLTADAPGQLSRPTQEGPHLGLVCISHSDAVRFRTITRTRFLKLDEAGRRTTLENLYQDNLSRLLTGLDFCHERHIRLYRMTSAMFPMSDLEEDPTGEQILEEMADQLAEVGRKAADLNIRVVMHPDQFIVLSSDSPRIVETSIKVLARHARNLDMMGLPATAWTAMTIHGGKGDRSEQFQQVVKTLPDNTRNRIVLENDEHAYGADQILDLCQKAGLPMVFDVHHHICHDKLENLEDPSIGYYLAAARQTWPDPDWQLTHISSGRGGFNDPAHHDFINGVPGALANAPWIEVEAKHKEEAIEKLREMWPIANE